MVEFLVETYTPRQKQNTAASRVPEVSLAAEQLRAEGTEVRLQQAIFLAEEETCFYLYQAASADAVREAARRAGLRPERITKAMSIKAAQAPRADAAITPRNAQEAT